MVFYLSLLSTKIDNRLKKTCTALTKLNIESNLNLETLELNGSVQELLCSKDNIIKDFTIKNATSSAIPSWLNKMRNLKNMTVRFATPKNFSLAPTKCISLQTIEIKNAIFTKINLTQNKKLKYIDFIDASSKVNSIDLSKNPKMKKGQLYITEKSDTQGFGFLNLKSLPQYSDVQQKQTIKLSGNGYYNLKKIPGYSKKRFKKVIGAKEALLIK